ncbi:hypothetical protein ONS96_001954 [Cadophora gregata f. sp. sojae]|nr:hypothetical protein ONS96_001954 [Cadophora gregata f. sp. sojae]
MSMEYMLCNNLPSPEQQITTELLSAPSSSVIPQASESATFRTERESPHNYWANNYRIVFTEEQAAQIKANREILVTATTSIKEPVILSTNAGTVHPLVFLSSDHPEGIRTVPMPAPKPELHGLDHDKPMRSVQDTMAKTTGSAKVPSQRGSELRKSSHTDTSPGILEQLPDKLLSPTSEGKKATQGNKSVSMTQRHPDSAVDPESTIEVERPIPSKNDNRGPYSTSPSQPSMTESPTSGVATDRSLGGKGDERKASKQAGPADSQPMSEKRRTRSDPIPAPIHPNPEDNKLFAKISKQDAELRNAEKLKRRKG